ncbi:MAG: tryptophan 7-halogenase [Chloroflexota bacterium]|nr:tryptophan 7-halogenase [Chloroflexota bacterium]
MSELKNTASVVVDQYDVAILGGGLAGLTLALEIKKARPASRILVIEKQKHPVPEAAYKVGESTVEIAGHYLRDILGLEDYLRVHQLRKFGLRFFFSTEHNLDITHRVELGLAAPHFLPTYQLDRGRFENALGCEIQQQGITFLDACKVEQIALQRDAHTLHLRQEEREFDVLTHWVVDASGRSSLLKRQLGLAKSVAHNANAAWFRVGQKIDINEWSNSAEWHARITDGERYLSTNHLCGKGYWVWLIPLASGSTSVGIVTDAAIHPFNTINRFDRALAWLHTYEPQCASIIERHSADIQDFRVMKQYSYSCQQVYSSDRWCLTGEAGVFTDPFYSPGSDFIAISNGLITHLITKDLDGEDIRGWALAYNHIYLSIANAWFNIYEQQYSLLGNAQVMVAKYIWDTAAYWGGLALLYFHDKIRALAHDRTLSVNLHRLTLLSTRIQAFFREWAAIDQTAACDMFVDHYNPLAFMKKFHAGMSASLTDAEFDAQFIANVEFLERLAGQMVSKVIEEYPTSTVDEAVLSQIQAWQADPLLSKAITIHQQADKSDPITNSWINLAHRSRDREQISS